MSDRYFRFLGTHIAVYYTTCEVDFDTLVTRKKEQRPMVSKIKIRIETVWKSTFYQGITYWYMQRDLTCQMLLVSLQYISILTAQG